MFQFIPKQENPIQSSSKLHCLPVPAEAVCNTKSPIRKFLACPKSNMRGDSVLKPGHFCPREDAPESWQSQQTPEPLGCLKFVPGAETHLGPAWSCESPRAGMQGRQSTEAAAPWEGGHPSCSSQLIHPSTRGQDLLHIHLGIGGALLRQTHLVQFMLLLVSAPADVCAQLGIMHTSRGELLPDT